MRSCYNGGVVKAVIFDLYGVLALNGWQAFKAKYFTARPEVWDEIFQLGRKVDAGLADYAELVRFTAEQSGESEATVRYQLEHTLANDELLVYIATELKPHYKLGILSNASSSHVLDGVFAKEQRALFDVVTLSRHVGHTKPEAEMYEAAASRLGVEVEECIFVDDQDRHATGAREAGMQAIVYVDFDQFKSDITKVLS
jgi:HAD superfamily hydrolase (TIGR01509 family)